MTTQNANKHFPHVRHSTFMCSRFASLTTVYVSILMKLHSWYNSHVASCVCVCVRSFVCAGVYLPLLWDASFCWHTPIALAYTRGHFSALVSMASSQTSEAGVWSNRSCDSHVTYLPLVDSEGRMLPIHFLTEQEVEPISSS